MNMRLAYTVKHVQYTIVATTNKRNTELHRKQRRTMKMKCILFAIVGLAPAFFAEASADVPSAGCESFEDVERRLCLKPGPSTMDAPPAVVQMCGA